MILSKKALAALSFASTLILPCAYAIDNGVYTIKSKYSAKFVEVASAQTNDGANVSQWANTNHDTQRWLITNIGGSNYSVINLNSGKALEVFDFSTADGGNVVQYEYANLASQHWQINDEGSGYYSFINDHSGKALDLYSTYMLLMATMERILASGATTAAMRSNGN